MTSWLTGGTWFHWQVSSISLAKGMLPLLAVSGEWRSPSYSLSLSAVLKTRQKEFRMNSDGPNRKQLGATLLPPPKPPQLPGVLILLSFWGGNTPNKVSFLCETCVCSCLVTDLGGPRQSHPWKDPGFSEETALWAGATARSRQGWALTAGATRLLCRSWEGSKAGNRLPAHLPSAPWNHSLC